MTVSRVGLKAVAAVRVAELTATAASYDPRDIGLARRPLYRELFRRLHAAGVTPAGPAIVYYEDPPEPSDAITVHAAVPITARPGAGRRLRGRGPARHRHGCDGHPPRPARRREAEPVDPGGLDRGSRVPRGRLPPGGLPGWPAGWRRIRRDRGPGRRGRPGPDPGRSAFRGLCPVPARPRKRGVRGRRPRTQQEQRGDQPGQGQGGRRPTSRGGTRPGRRRAWPVCRAPRPARRPRRRAPIWRIMLTTAGAGGEGVRWQRRRRGRHQRRQGEPDADPGEHHARPARSQRSRAGA